MQWSAIVAVLVLMLTLVLARADQSLEQQFENAMAEANAGDANAQNLLGAIYQTGSGVGRNDEEAARWYSKAAAQGDAAAQANLGSMYMEGKGVPRDAKRGIELLKLSAAQKFPLGIARLGAAHAQGAGVPKDVKGGTELLLQAVDSGVGLAAYELAKGHLKGSWAPADEQEATKWFRKSAELGYANGQYVYAKNYETDEGRKWELFHRAAMGGSTLLSTKLACSTRAKVISTKPSIGIHAALWPATRWETRLGSSLACLMCQGIIRSIGFRLPRRNQQRNSIVIRQ